MIKKFFFILFNVLGFLTFLGLVSAAAFLGIRHYKSQAITEASTTADTTVAIRTVSMTPEKQPDIATTPPQTLPDFQPISRKPVSASKTTKPVRHVQHKQTPALSARPVAHTATLSASPAKASAKAVKPIATKANPKSQKPRPATTVHADLGIPAEPHRRYQVTDRSASPRSGGSRIPDVTAPPSELEKQAMRHAENIRQLEEETAKLRNPPVEQTALMKLFSGGEK